jgi:hypothetical protein
LMCFPIALWQGERVPYDGRRMGASMISSVTL